MRKYWKYFKYIIEHKKNVFIECWGEGLYIHAFTHDLSKFRPSEFIPYARYFYETDREKNYTTKTENNKNFQLGWNHHQNRNKHHWNYWVSVTRKNEITAIPMPKRFMKQMLSDWNGMSRKFGSNTKEYWLKEKENFIIHKDTVKEIEKILGVSE